jgi:hypothetical protein
MAFLSFPHLSHIEFLCPQALWKEAFLSPSAMSLARLDYDRGHLQVVPKPRRKSVASGERVSDVWPDWSTEFSAADLVEGAEKNRPFTVLREAAGAVIYSVGLVILLIAVLSALHIR